eukprot:TRINITY_DN34453_c0_g1_i1.p1 TRINITY_DN34453_c0_g1~~TRINITY_DN34453_c0_g1_i1.p1  ORF type:complete len:226 (-),score=16.11 TRINITY_DN34453_c0_g1_i1:195-848(-)
MVSRCGTRAAIVVSALEALVFIIDFAARGEDVLIITRSLIIAAPSLRIISLMLDSYKCLTASALIFAIVVLLQSSCLISLLFVHSNENAILDLFFSAVSNAITLAMFLAFAIDAQALRLHSLERAVADHVVDRKIANAMLGPIVPGTAEFNEILLGGHCCVCLGPLSDREGVIALLCHHTFHHDCLIRWHRSPHQFRNTVACPMRCKVTSKKHQRLA